MMSYFAADRARALAGGEEQVGGDSARPQGCRPARGRRRGSLLPITNRMDWGRPSLWPRPKPWLRASFWQASRMPPGAAMASRARLDRDIHGSRAACGSSASRITIAPMAPSHRPWWASPESLAHRVNKGLPRAPDRRPSRRLLRPELVPGGEGRQVRGRIAWGDRRWATIGFIGLGNMGADGRQPVKKGHEVRGFDLGPATRGAARAGLHSRNRAGRRPRRRRRGDHAARRQRYACGAGRRPARAAAAGTGDRPSTIDGPRARPTSSQLPFFDAPVSVAWAAPRRGR